MSEARSSVGPAILVFGCLGLLVLSLMVAAVGMGAIVLRAASSSAEDRPAIAVGPMDPGWPPAPPPMPAPAPGDPLAVPAPMAVPEPIPMPEPIDPMVDIADPLGASIPSAPVPAASRIVVARVTRARGLAAVRRGTTCRFAVDRVDLSPDGSSYRCRTQATCGETLVYGGSSAGYFTCTLELPPALHVSGEDDATTSADTDGAFAIDSAAGTLRIRDDAAGPNGAFELEARILGVEPSSPPSQL